MQEKSIVLVCLERAGLIFWNDIDRCWEVGIREGENIGPELKQFEESLTGMTLITLPANLTALIADAKTYDIWSLVRGARELEQAAIQLLEIVEQRLNETEASNG